MSEIWFSSDLHLGHQNIIEFCDRPFQSVSEMDEKLREWHNSFVKPEDHWYNLGDVTMKRSARDELWLINEMRKWNGHKRLLLGNHDHFPVKVYLEAGFEKIYATWRGIDNILLSHIPVHPASMGTACSNVHGHIHNNQGDQFAPVKSVDPSTQKEVIRPYVNVSIEVINYHPITLGQVKELIKKGVDGENSRVQVEG
jgi:calcineurin-like phosphoesterase family protein